MTATMAFRRLNKVENLAVGDLIEDVRDAFKEVVPLDADQTTKVEALLLERFTEEGPMLAKALAALFLERIRTGDKQAGEQDPPEDGMLGLVIDDYMGKVWPLVLSPSVTTETFRKAILD
jgi:hypothetical protein